MDEEEEGELLPVFWVTSERPLPEELSLAIVSHLDAGTLATFALVSRACHRLSLDPCIWKGLCEREMAEWPCHQAFIRLASAQLSKLRQSGGGGGGDDGAGLWWRPFSWRAFFRCEALHPWPEERFYLRQRIGKGAFVTLFKALERDTDRVVAIRLIDLEREVLDLEHGRQVVLIDDERQRRRVFEEKEKLAAHLMPITWRSPNLLSVYGLYWRPTTGTMCLSREYAPRALEDEDDAHDGHHDGEHHHPGGGDGEHHERAVGRDEARVAAILRDVVAGVCELEAFVREGHALGPIDLRYEKLLVSEAGRVAINIDSLFSVTPCIIGSPYYVAPEVRLAENSRADRAEVWAVGLIAIRLATGRLPMCEVHPMRYLYQLEQLAPRELEGAFSPELKDLVRRCLERDPEHRPSPQDLLAHPFLVEHATSEPPPPSS